MALSSSESGKDVERLFFDYAVVGAGPAGVAAARVLAQRAGSGKVVLISDEDRIPYERPALSKAALTSSGNSIPRICSTEEFDSIGLTFLCRTEVARISRDERCLHTNAGHIRYGTLLLATGSSPIRLKVLGDHLSQLFYLRKAVDAEALRAVLADRPRIVVVGGGFIGLEVAASARSMGCEVLVVTKGAFLMNRCLPEQIARPVASQLEASGIQFRFVSELLAVEGSGKVEGVRLATGEFVPADIVVVGIGSTPNCALPIAAGLEVDDGVIVDEQWRTSDPHIFAAGDVARRRLSNACAGSRGARLESWEPASEHGQLAASAMLGDLVEEPSAPWMWSDQNDLNIQIAGNPDPDAPMILRHAPDHGGIIAAFLKEARITGAITVNDGRSMSLLRRAIDEERSVDAVLLADPAVELRQALGMRRRA